jgi:acyl-CoA dehydrogenase
MPTYSPPLSEYEFVVRYFLRLNVQNSLYIEMPSYSMSDLQVLPDFLRAAADLCIGVVQPLNQKGDRQGCRWVAGEVQTPDGFKEAYAEVAKGGWIGLNFPTQHGGLGLSGVFAQIFSEMLCSANMAFSGYIELSEAVMAALLAHGSPDQQHLYLIPLLSGRWTGAMHLTEPQAGSDLGLISVYAEECEDGTFRLFGSKTFITNAEHDLAENIIHLVLARVPGQPDGSRGLSVFIVPKYLPNAQGNPGERNSVSCISIEHKLGLRAAPTGVIEYNGAQGFLLGKKNEGMKVMFTTVNDARLGVAIQGLAQAEVACQNAVTYARDRRQGTALRGSLKTAGFGHSSSPIAISEHPDVRRMLLGIRAFTEAARGLTLWLALQIDTSQHHPDSARRLQADRLVALLTPVAKAHLTDEGFAATSQGLQCHGGYGYVQETGVDQFLRDVRITQIYEGTNGIQALELVRRKIGLDGGAAVDEFVALVREAIEEAEAELLVCACTVSAFEAEALQVIQKAMAVALDDLCPAIEWHRSAYEKDAMNSAAGATDLLRLFGIVTLGWVWLRYAIAASLALRSGDGDPEFLRRKLALARFYARRVLPESHHLRERTQLGADDLMSLQSEAL